jgi:L-seryl-tRNA(Ser) seleniumtransferase
MSDDALRGLPRVDRVVAHASLETARRRLGAKAVTELARRAIGDARRAARDGAGTATLHEIAGRVAKMAEASLGARVRRVINATGVVLHTNLGRAPLARSAVDALAASAGAYTSIEIDLATGRRGARAAFAEEALARLTGAESALVVNNNAAAVLLALASTAAGRGVVVSRGELVEIGGGFRIPEVLARSGARMIEVGTTNRTRPEDYARALDESSDVAALLRVHPGNFRQTGFVERPRLDALVALARSRKVALIEDLGGGLLSELGVAELSGEPVVGASVAAGTDVVCFSTDKALGGPQGGALVGRAPAIERARRDPLARALRIGRLPLVALEATLAHHLEGAIDAVPAIAALRRPTAEVCARAERWRDTLASLDVACEGVALDAVAGGGSFADESLPSAGIALASTDPGALLDALRAADPPVIARIDAGRVVLDARTVLDGEDDALLRSIAAAVRSLAHAACDGDP